MPNENSKSVKKEEIEDEVDEKIRAAILNRKKKSTKDNGISTPRTASKVKKEENKLKKEEADEDFDEPSSKKTSNKTDNKKKVKKEEEEAEDKKKGAKPGDVKKREKKVYDLPGQKRDPPEERDPLRIFYETLHEQVPGSEMAAIWMMECGLLSKEEAKKVFDRKQKKTQQQKLSSPMKTVVNVKKKVDSVSVVKKSSTKPISTHKKKTPDSKTASKQSKKRKSKDDSSEDDWDDDFVPENLPKKQRAS